MLPSICEALVMWKDTLERSMSCNHKFNIIHVIGTFVTLIITQNLKTAHFEFHASNAVSVFTFTRNAQSRLLEKNIGGTGYTRSAYLPGIYMIDSSIFGKHTVYNDRYIWWDINQNGT